MRVLVVEDEPRMAELLQRGLTGEGYAVDVTGNGTDALWMTGEVDYDAIVLDAMIPAPNGFEVVASLRKDGKQTPVIMLTARDSVDDRVRGLDHGADDYLTKPFAFAELFARLRALVRRPPAVHTPLLTVGDLVLDPSQHQLRRGEVEIDLSPTEYSLAEYLMRNAGRVCTRTQILEHVWDFAFDPSSNVVDVYIRYLRAKLDRPFGTDSIETIRGAGYMLRADAAQSRR